MSERLPRGSVERARGFGAWYSRNHPELSATEIGRIYNQGLGGRLHPRLIWHVADGARKERRRLTRADVTR